MATAETVKSAVNNDESLSMPVVNNKELSREQMVRNAISFMQNPRLRSTPLHEKQQFLRRKGLTDEEIQLACERAGAYNQFDPKNLGAPPLPMPLNPYNPYNQLQSSFFYRLREIVHNIAIFSIVGYFLHKLYKKYVEPFLFGRKKKTLQESIEEMDNNMKTSIDEMKSSIGNVKTEVDKLAEVSDSSTIYRQISEVKSEIAMVKGLLLSRKQFPSVANSPVVPPSIPAWQMSSVQAEHDQDQDADQDRKEDLLEMGSGSGSEPEHCTKTSESSLEIIYTTRDCDTESCNSRKSKEDLDKE